MPALHASAVATGQPALPSAMPPSTNPVPEKESGHFEWAELPLYIACAVLAVFVGVSAAARGPQPAVVGNELPPNTYPTRADCHAQIQGFEHGCVREKVRLGFRIVSLALIMRSVQQDRDGFSIVFKGRRLYGGRHACETDDETLSPPRRCVEWAVKYVGITMPLFQPDTEL